ncbi:hypothetical protein BT67DRAFT_161157 [Trichocladium antarcticum]|uniref:Uncharacterized protein n=1 Tax=Trichocladium antarcticum TaxID=1450529 RepID=A0AAN6UE53_9PEZI|nr:hypothetical protein BT67DRAFT_161157 [Trichocladium antarcticum]
MPYQSGGSPLLFERPDMQWSNDPKLWPKPSTISTSVEPQQLRIPIHPTIVTSLAAGSASRSRDTWPRDDPMQGGRPQGGRMQRTRPMFAGQQAQMGYMGLGLGPGQGPPAPWGQRGGRRG